jgi:hypothetical protein
MAANGLVHAGPKVAGFAHIAMVNNWAEIVAEQFAMLRSSGLLARTCKLSISLLGEGDLGEFESEPRVHIAHRGSCLNDYEFPILQELYEFCATGEYYVYYFHTKGVVRHPNCPNVRAWRNYMEHFVLGHHKCCTAALAAADVCGVDWYQEPWPHFSGNFWWATSSYVRTLPPPVGLNHAERHQCEAWIGMNEKVRAVSLNQSNANLYRTLIGASSYHCCCERP